MAWKDQGATRKTLRLVNNGGALLKHFANPPEVTPEVETYKQNKHTLTNKKISREEARRTKRTGMAEASSGRYR